MIRNYTVPFSYTFISQQCYIEHRTVFTFVSSIYIASVLPNMFSIINSQCYMWFVAELLMKTFNLIKFSLFLCIPSPHSIATNYSTTTPPQPPPPSLSLSLGKLPTKSLQSQCHGYFSDYQEGICKLRCRVPYPQGLSLSFQNTQSQMSQSEVLLSHSDTSAESSLLAASHLILYCCQT